MSEAVRARAVFFCCFFLAIASPMSYNRSTTDNKCELHNMAVFPLLPRECSLAIVASRV